MTANLPRKWAPKSKAERYEPLVPLDERIARVRRRYAAGEHYQRRLAIFDSACARIDRKAFGALQAKYAADLADFNPAGPLKYVDIVYWIWHKTEHAERPNLDRCGPMAILDIGMGGGHFSFVCEALGHTTVGTDIPYPIYDDICDALGVKRVREPVSAFTALPDFGRTFDLVTAIWLMFNFMTKRRVRSYWGAAEWAWFLADAGQRLNSGGEIYLELNQHKTADGVACWDEPFIEQCRAAGAAIKEDTFRGITLGTAAIAKFISLSPAEPLAAQ